jgi:phosphoserine aminotransferase
MLIQSGRKFKVVYDSAEKVKEGDVNVPPQPEGHGYSQQELVETTAFVDNLIIEKLFDFPAAIRSNGLSDLKLVTVEEFLRNAWEGRT